MTPGYVHASKRWPQAVAQLEASIKAKNQLLVKVDKARAEVQGKLDLAEEHIKNLAKANATLVEEVKTLRAKAEELEADQAPAPVEPARDDNQLLIDALEADNKRLREEKSTLLEERQALEIEKAILSNRLTKTQQAAKTYREANGQLGSQVEGLVEAVAGAVIPGQVLTIHEGKVIIHRRELDLPSFAQTLRQAAEAVTAHALTEELA